MKNKSDNKWSIINYSTKMLLRIQETSPKEVIYKRSLRRREGGHKTGEKKGNYSKQRAAEK